MRGGFVHTNILLAFPQACFRSIGARISFEHPVRVFERKGAIDMLVFAHFLLAIEAETSWTRAHWDVEKALAAGAKDLIILTPTERLAGRCRQVVERKLCSIVRLDLSIFYFTLPAFNQWFTNCFRLFPKSFGSFPIPENKAIKQS